jgi:hypothetical protein
MDWVASLIATTALPERYVPLFAFPKVDSPKAVDLDPAADGYFSQAVAGPYADKLNNTFALMRPEVVFLVGLSSNQLSFLDFVPMSWRHVLSSQAAVESCLRQLGPMRSVTSCRMEQLPAGLFAARTVGAALRCDTSAPTLPSLCRVGSRGIVILESSNDLNDLVAASYAHAIGADFAVIPPVDRALVGNVNALLLDSANGSADAKRQIVELLSAQLDGIEWKSYQHATFFTEGMPYGYLLGTGVVCSHVWKPICDLMTVNSIAQSTLARPRRFGSAVVFSPEVDLGSTARAEVRTAGEELLRHGFIVFDVVGKRATVKSLATFGTHCPYDLMHLCSHGGQTTGYYVRQEFADRAGVKHVIEFHEVVGFSPAGTHDGVEMVSVFSKAIFKRLDGLMWNSPELRARQLPSYVFEDLRVALTNKDDAGVTRVPIKGFVEHSAHIRCSDSIHQGEWQSLASSTWPIIFNNTCSSSQDILDQILGAGCRAYIGTLWNVGNETARKAASEFYSCVFEEPLAVAVSRMNANIQNPKYSGIYIYWGLHFDRLVRPTLASPQPILREAGRAIHAWEAQVARATRDYQKRYGLDAIQFLKRLFGSEQVDKPAAQESTPTEGKEPPRESPIERSEPTHIDLPLRPPKHG